MIKSGSILLFDIKAFVEIQLDALKYGFSHVPKSSHFATECRKLVEKRAEQRTWLYYLGSITQ